MERCNTTSEWQKLQQKWKDEGLRIAFVPTMGALHAGHLSLVKLALEHADRCVVSIFVNPTQFDNPDDLLKYPRTVDSDIEMLQAEGCHAVFTPNVDEIYPESQDTAQVDYGVLTSVLEAEKRPGHYDGVVQVVRRLFQLIQPDVAVVGKKDYQQLSIIRHLNSSEGIGIEIVGAPLMRDHDGIALSSRNVRLSENGRQTALCLSKTLLAMKEQWKDVTPYHLQNWGKYILHANPDVTLEYLEVVDGKDFEFKPDWGDYHQPMALLAAHVDGVRLIDNVEFR